MADRRVDFLGIGVQKAATSWLFECLNSHPDVVTPGLGNKELNFFNHNYEKGYAWYHGRFPERPGVVGEFSPLYFPDRDVPSRVRKYRSDVRLLLCLRDPVDRAFSQHLHEVSRRRIPPELFGFWDAERHNPTYVEQGLYADHLERWLTDLDRECLHVVIYDDVVADPARVFGAVCSFLGIPEKSVPEIGQRRNVSTTVRSRGAHRALRRMGARVRRVAGDRAFEAIRRLGVVRLVRERLEVEIPETEVPRLSPEERQRLRACFESDIRRLEDLLGRDLSAWR